MQIQWFITGRVSTIFRLSYWTQWNEMFGESNWTKRASRCSFIGQITIVKLLKIYLQ